MKKQIVIALFPVTTLLYGQPTEKDCTAESVRNEPGRFLDNHTGKGLRREAYTGAELSTIAKNLTAVENVCKKNLTFNGGQAKASFMLNSRMHYNQVYAPVATYNLGFHEFVCNIQTHKLAIVSEYQGVLRVTTNPPFRQEFRLDRNNNAFKQKPGTTAIPAPFISIFNYFSFEDPAIVAAINNGHGFFELDQEVAGGQGCHILEQKPGKGTGYMFNGNFIGGVDYVYMHAYLTHNDIPFFIPITRKKFLEDLLEYYDREKPLLQAAKQEKLKNQRSTVAEMTKNNNPYLDNAKKQLAILEQDVLDIVTAYEKNKSYAQNLLKDKDEKWLSQPAAVEPDNKTFITYDLKRNREDVYGNFYFREFYTGSKGILLYQMNPDYLKKYPVNGPKPAIIDVMYRYRSGNIFTKSVRDSYINNIDLEGLRKLL